MDYNTINNNNNDAAAADVLNESAAAAPPGAPGRRMKAWLYVLLSGLLLLSASALFFIFAPLFIQINGDETVAVDVFSVYEDAGAVAAIGGRPLTGTGEVDTEHIGTYKVAYRWFLQTRYRTVSVVDREAPEIELLGRDLMLAAGEDYSDPGVQASDNYDGDLTALVTVSGDVDSAQAGEYALVYSVSDSSGNEVSTTRKVFVLDDDLSYCREMRDDKNCPQPLLETVTAFLDRYYCGLKYLRQADFSDLFAADAAALAATAAAAVDYTVTYRGAAANDLRLDDCAYTITVTDLESLDNGLTRVDFTEDATLCFHCLPGVESRQGGVVNSFTLRRENGKYVIVDFYREEGVFSYLQDDAEALSAERRESFLQAAIAAQQKYDEEKELINAGAVCPELSCAVAYDREQARAYALQYALTRNAQYNAFDSNCANFVSQCLHAGGIPMDDVSPYQWKNFSDSHDEVTAGSGYTASWVYIPTFVEYLRNGDIVAQTDIYLYFAQPGDVIALLRSEDEDVADSPHVVVVSGRVTDEEGNLIEILYCGNTNDQLDLPLSAQPMPAKKLIKIYGYNKSE
ncbi:MAG: DUF5011 domain-containing protein [Firmicutes bacterium]|nr:DUF5011 domain-containing protein [Bacillota bacterium]